MRPCRATGKLSSQPTREGLLWLPANALEETWRLAVGEVKRVLGEREKLSKSILASIYYALGSGLYSPIWLLVMKSRGSFIDSAVYYISPLSLYRQTVDECDGGYNSNLLLWKRAGRWKVCLAYPSHVIIFCMMDNIYKRARNKEGSGLLWVRFRPADGTHWASSGLSLHIVITNQEL